MPSRPARLTLAATALLLATTLDSADLAAQRAGSAPAASRGNGTPAARDGGPALAGSYTGTATVPLGDSTIVVPVTYTFTGTAPAIGGTAVVPGQGSGAISQVVREGNRLRFRVLASQPQAKGPPTTLDHEGTVSADGTIEGFVNLDGKPVAKFRIAPAASSSAPRGRSGAPETRRSTRGSTP